MHCMDARVAATEATLARFRERPFVWGKVDCVKLVAWHLRRMGHRNLGIARAGGYRTALSAKAALKRAGFETMGDALDAAGLVRIAPAAALVGDILAMPGEAGFDALCIDAGNGAVIGFHQDSDTVEVARMMQIPLTAWRA